MAAQYKTKCPHCGAQFRISEQHLAQAKGAVRCGSCLKVFQATDHLIEDKPAAKPAAPAKSARPAAPAAAPKADKWSLTEDLSSPPAGEPTPPAARRWTLDDDLSDDMDEEMPEKLVDEPPPSTIPSNDTRVSLGGLELSDSFMSLDSDDQDTLRDENFADMAGAGKKLQSEDSDESWAEKLLEELEDKPAPVDVRADNLSLTERSEDQVRREQQEQKKQRTTQASQKKSDDMPDWAMDSGDFFNDDSLGALTGDNDDIAAIDIPAIEERKTSKVSLPLENIAGQSGELIKWGALSLAGLLVFVSQYLIFNFSELSRTPAWRPFYANICGAIGCSLPSLSNISELRGANLVVRAHPQAEGALVVDVIVFNDGRHAQPFPLLELGFTDLNGRAIASRRFQPDEYLRGEISDMTEMPPGVPIRLSLEILDPGSDAQNYTLRFLPVSPRG
ncbi:MAG: zinc-ribbon and DUF3426 domain-containing protein [Alcanivoracaceae bacterium]|jgi:predicted Zn finger-like uncharacterized protein|nr:zinc-ribbon and DUF3426 domain-containing protein [Alcanivoracaceae bacterium]